MQLSLNPPLKKRDKNKQHKISPPLTKGGRGDLLCLFIVVLFLLPSPTLAAGSWSGYLATESRYYFNPPLHPGQREQSISFSGQPEFYQEWQTKSFTAAPFFRIDSADSERSHFDLRELFFLWYPGDFELGIGIRKIFWGVTESQHLVDIINQTDLVELPDGEKKLGQPMIHFSLLRDLGTLDFFLLPYFRERTFPGPKGRLRGPFSIDSDQARFESGEEKHHLDLAIRYSQSLEAWDIGLSHFKGTSREPTLLPGIDGAGNPVLIPLYAQIEQTGLDIQRIIETWLLKLEIIHRSGQGSSFQAWTGGFEYSFTRIFSSMADLGIIGEWLHDTRDENATTPFEDDMMLGLRLALNDMESTEILLGLIQDLNQTSRIINIEGNRRFGDHWKLALEGFIFTGLQPGELIYSQRDDDFLQLTLAYYF